MQCFDWNAVSFGNDCYVDGFLQFHTLENMMLKVKRTHIEDGCAVNTGATLMGGAVIERDTHTLSVVTGTQGDQSGNGNIRRKPRAARGRSDPGIRKEFKDRRLCRSLGTCR